MAILLSWEVKNTIPGQDICLQKIMEYLRLLMCRMKTLWHVNYQKMPLLFAGLFSMLKSSELTDFKFHTFAFSGHAPAHAG